MDTACFSFVSAGDRARSSRLYPAALAGLSADPRSTNRSKSSGGGVNTPCCLAFSPCLLFCLSLSLSYSPSHTLSLSRSLTFYARPLSLYRHFSPSPFSALSPSLSLSRSRAHGIASFPRYGVDMYARSRNSLVPAVLDGRYVPRRAERRSKSSSPRDKRCRAEPRRAKPHSAAPNHAKPTRAVHGMPRRGAARHGAQPGYVAARLYPVRRDSGTPVDKKTRPPSELASERAGG